MENTIVLTTGQKSYQIVNELGEEVGVLKFNPADFDLPRRFEEMQNELSKLDIPDEPSFEQFYAVTDKIKSLFDFALGSKVSDDLFGKSNPLNILPDGSFYFVNVLEKVAQIVDATVTERNKVFNKKVDEAVANIVSE